MPKTAAAPVLQLDHLSLRTSDLEGTRRFFTDVIGLTVGPRPPFDFPGYWLYHGEAAMVHLIGETGAGADDAESGSTGIVDHVAFRCTDYSALRTRLEAAGARYTERSLPGGGGHQVFVDGPGGLVVELGFAP